jgi:hypothetical protein
MPLEKTIRTAEQRITLYKAQVVVVRDVEADDVEVARIKQ